MSLKVSSILHTESILSLSADCKTVKSRTDTVFCLLEDRESNDEIRNFFFRIYKPVEQIRCYCLHLTVYTLQILFPNQFIPFPIRYDLCPIYLNNISQDEVWWQ